MTDLLWDASWRIVIVAVIAALASLAARTAAARHAVWTAVLCSMLLMPVLTWVVPPLAVPILRAPVGETYTPPPVAPVPAIRAQSTAPVPTSLRVPWLAVLYGLGVILCGIRFGRAWLLTRRLIAGSLPVPGFVHVRQSEFISVPITLGLRAPLVLLPSEWTQWTDWKLRTVLAHEFAHIERKDTWVALLANLNACVFWFHPLAWWLKRELAECAERAADDASILATGDRASYAELLLEVASGLKRPQRLMGVAMARHSRVGKRIHQILDDSRRLAAVMNWSGWLALALAAVPLVYAAAAVQAVPRTPAGPSLQGAIVMAPKEDIASLEAKVSANPEDTASRVKLITLYTAARNSEGRFTHLMWMIEHRPDSALHQTYPRPLPPGAFPAESMEDYVKICEAWTRQADVHPANPSVLINAAEAMRWAAPEQSEALLKRALQVNPADWSALQSLARLYSQLIEAVNGAPYPGVQKKSEMTKRIQEELLASTNAALVGNVGATLANSPLAPSVNELGKRLVERANALDPPRSASQPSQLPGRIRVGGNAQAAKLIRKVDPEYPPLARQARIQGTVRFTAIIGRDGKIANLQLVSGHPLLVSAAQEAARQYEYQPTLLNGQPVEVVTQVDVNFTLGTEAPQASADSPTRIRVGGGVQAAKLINKVDPEYPPLAKQARIQGTVRFTATIGKDGNVEKVELVSGHPLLVQAATNAVKQYKYQPTFLNGQPVELTTYVDVNFQLP